jgi:hypothetical protein
MCLGHVADCCAAPGFQLRVRFDRFSLISISALFRPTTRCFFGVAFAPLTASLQAKRMLLVSRDRRQLGVSLMESRVAFPDGSLRARLTTTRPGLAPAGESLLVDAKRNKNVLNVHAHRGMHKHSTRCVHLRTTTPEILLHPCTCVETGVHRALCMAEAHASTQKPRGTSLCAVWPTCQGQCGRFAFSECSMALVTARVHGWSSISGVVASR